MIRRLLLCAAVGFACLSFHTQAKENNDESQLRAIANNPIWRNLLRYEPDSSSSSGYLSAIHSPSFFLSKNGRFDAYSELKATLSGFQTPIGNSPDEHARCRFPARFLFLRRILGDQWLTGRETFSCPRFDQWRQYGQVHSISVVYATGFLDNPASFYGHTLLKWNGPKSRLTSALDDTSLNYGAIIPDGEDPVSYIFKGVFGGYDAGFSDIKYYFHDYNYGDNELRDLWEYELDLSPQEVELMVAYGWEVLGKRYTYYFTKQNCAYRMAELFNIIDGLDLIPDNSALTFPQAVMQRIADAQIHGHPLLKKITPNFSRQSRLYNKYRQLSVAEKSAVSTIAGHVERLDSPIFEQLNVTSQRKVIEVLIDYYQVVRDKYSDDDPLNLAYKQILARRFTLPVGSAKFDKKKAVKAPHEGRKPSLIRTGITHNSDQGNALYLDFRPAYYDALDADSGHIPGAELDMAHLSLDVREDRASLRQLDIVNIRKINVHASGLPGDDGFAWNLRAGWQRADNTCTSCTTLRLSSDAGYSWNMDHAWILATYIGGGLQDNRQSQGNWFTQATVEAQYPFRDDLRFRLMWQYRQFEGKQQYHPLSAEFRYRLDTNLDLRLALNHEKSDEITFSVGYFW